MAGTIQDNDVDRQAESDEIGVARGIRKKKSSISFKGVGVVFLIVALVIGSFWLSFLIGKRIMSPMKQLPKAQMPGIETYKVPEGLPVYDAPKSEVTAPPEEKMPEKAVPMPPKPVKKVVIKKDPFFAKKKEAAKEKAKKAKAETVKAASEILYKVRTAIAGSKEKAVTIGKELKEKGFDEIFVYDLGSGKYSVQVGVFRKKENAEKMLKDLKTKGFDANITTDE